MVAGSHNREAELAKAAEGKIPIKFTDRKDFLHCPHLVNSRSFTSGMGTAEEAITGQSCVVSRVQCSLVPCPHCAEQGEGEPYGGEGRSAGAVVAKAMYEE